MFLNISVLQTVTLSESLRAAAGLLPPIITQSESGRTLQNINTASLRKLSTFQHLVILCGGCFHHKDVLVDRGSTDIHTARRHYID